MIDFMEDVIFSNQLKQINYIRPRQRMNRFDRTVWSALE